MHRLSRESFRSAWRASVILAPHERKAELAVEFAARLGRGGLEVQLRWRCVDGPPDWIGTRIAFDLSEQDGRTILNFGHRDWAEPGESMAHCSMKWAVFPLSLKDYVQTGKGRPFPGDLKIDNWN